MKKIINIEGSPNLARDLHSHAIINKDAAGLQNHLVAKEKRKKEADRIIALESDVSFLKHSISEILDILKTGSKK